MGYNLNTVAQTKLMNRKEKNITTFALKLFEGKKDLSFFVVDPHRPSSKNLVPPDAIAGDIVYDYRGLIVCLRDSEKDSEYLVCDGNGELLARKNAGSLDEASQAAEAWIREYHAEEDEDDEEVEYTTTSDGEICYSYRGRIIGIREAPDYTQCSIYDGDGEDWLESVGAGDRGTACKKAEAWVRQNHSEKYDVAGDESSYEEDILEYHSYIIRIKLLTNGCFQYSVFTSRQSIIARNMLSSYQLAQYCAEAWIRKHCLKQSI